MKKLVVINGTMGVGKSAVCECLLKELAPGVYLDGDWCWNMNPFVVNDENKKMVTDNIAFLLNAFLWNSGYEYVLFCWVMHREEIFQEILSGLQARPFELHRITLLCSEDELIRRLSEDVKKGIRQEDVVRRSVERLALYHKLPTRKIDVSDLSPEQAADRICKIIREEKGVVL